MAAARRQWEGSASRMLAAIVQPGGKAAARATKLEDVFDRIEYLGADARDVDAHLCPAGGVSDPDSPSSRDMDEVAADVSAVVSSGLVENLGPVVEMMATVPVKQACPRLTSPIDLAAARLLGPLSREALAGCLDAVRAQTGEDGKVLVQDYGALCGAAIRRALETFDAAGARFGNSPVARRLRADLQENLYAEL